MDRPRTSGIILDSYTLLHNRLMGLVQRLADDTDAMVQGKQQGDPGVWALGAIALADTAVEIAINHTVETAFPPHSMMPEHWPVHQFAFEHLGKTRPPLDRLKALTRMQRRSPNWNDEPWASVRDLHTVRNALMHYESRPVRSTDPTVTTFPNAEKLRPIAQRLGTLVLYEGGGTWLEVFLNLTVARWAYETADRATRLLNSKEWRWKVPIPPSDLAAGKE